MSGIVFWMSGTRYSGRWITLCEERRRTSRCRQQPPRRAIDRLRKLNIIISYAHGDDLWSIQRGLLQPLSG